MNQWFGSGGSKKMTKRDGHSKVAFYMLQLNTVESNVDNGFFLKFDLSDCFVSHQSHSCVNVSNAVTRKHFFFFSSWSYFHFCPALVSQQKVPVKSVSRPSGCTGTASSPAPCALAATCSFSPRTAAASLWG